MLKQLLPLLKGDALTVTGKTMAENVEAAAVSNPEIIRSLDDPLSTEGGLSILRGNLAPDGAVIKHAAATPELTTHRGLGASFSKMWLISKPVFTTPALDVRPDHVLVLQNAGPVGGPGMPEVGNLPIPQKLLKQGVRDMVRISDARMSGTSYGTIVLHVAPESALGGPLALVRDGDIIELNVSERRLHLHVSDEELQRRRAGWSPPAPAFGRGYGQMYLRHVNQAPLGCDFDFLRGKDPVAAGEQPKF